MERPNAPAARVTVAPLSANSMRRATSSGVHGLLRITSSRLRTFDGVQAWMDPNSLSDVLQASTSRERHHECQRRDQRRRRLRQGTSERARQG
ncbi:unnamed protein product, partial [Didymodactylos carnosus]